MNRILCNIISCFILKKKNRHHFRNRYKNFSIVNFLRMRSFKNKYKGKRCFIVGNAPSLEYIDISKLNTEYVFTTNRGYLLQKLGLNRSTFHVIEDQNFFDDFKYELNTTFFKTLFMRSNIQTKLYKHISYDYFNSPTMDENVFQFNCCKPLYRGCSVALSTVQLAVYMGFTDIYFIGVDLYSNKDKLHFYDSEQGELARSNIMPIDKVKKGFKNAYNLLKSKNINIYNAGVGGDLNEIPRVEFDEVFKS